MTLGLAYWIIMLVWLVFGVLWRSGFIDAPYAPVGNYVLLFVLFGLLGWQVFGPPLRR
jgi:ABC-type polysaccharide/polyol phosphate export permease